MNRRCFLGILAAIPFLEKPQPEKMFGTWSVKRNGRLIDRFNIPITADGIEWTGLTTMNVNTGMLDIHRFL